LIYPLQILYGLIPGTFPCPVVSRLSSPVPRSRSRSFSVSEMVKIASPEPAEAAALPNFPPLPNPTAPSLLKILSSPSSSPSPLTARRVRTRYLARRDMSSFDKRESIHVFDATDTPPLLTPPSTDLRPSPSAPAAVMAVAAAPQSCSKHHGDREMSLSPSKAGCAKRKRRALEGEGRGKGRKRQELELIHYIHYRYQYITRLSSLPGWEDREVELHLFCAHL